MQILAITFFLSILTLAIGSMRLLLIEHADKIGNALAGESRSAAYVATGVVIPFRQFTYRALHHDLRVAA